MSKTRCGESRLTGCTPIHATRWEEMFVENGVLYAVYWSGDSKHCLCMGPCLVLEGIERAKRALVGGAVIPAEMAKKALSGGH